MRLLVHIKLKNIKYCTLFIRKKDLNPYQIIQAELRKEIKVKTVNNSCVVYS